MPSKIFISYRREDSAANALGIGQYLEHHFGHKNVFIDVDMRAGTKFPAVLEQRLAECKVLLALIGPEWLNARDEQGQRRLDKPDDWVRLEIAQALTRNITVIPVRVNGAELPSRQTLPDDIRGLLDHQAVSISIAGFRHEMSGLVRDIRAISSRRPWRRFGAVAAGLLLLLIVFILALGLRLPNALKGLSPSISPQISQSAKQNYIWTGSPGEWVLYEIGNKRIADYFKPSSVRIFGDRAVYTTRYPLEPAPSEKVFSQAAYQDDTVALDCKKSIWVLAERTVYDKTGEVLSHIKVGDPESLNLSNGISIGAGSVAQTAEHIVCNRQVGKPILSKEQLAKSNLSYLNGTPNGDGEIFYGSKHPSENSAYQFELLVVWRYFGDQALAGLFPGWTVIGLPASYRTFAEPLQLNCKERKILIPKIEYFDSDNNLIYLSAPISPEPIDVENINSPFGLLLTVGCGTSVPQVGGTYEGTNDAAYKSGAQGEQKIAIIVQQNGGDVSVVFQTANGGQGKGTGALTGTVVNSLSMQNTTPGCSGSYEGTLNFADDTMSWSYKGQDCNGVVEGHGTAKRTKS